MGEGKRKEEDGESRILVLDARKTRACRCLFGWHYTHRKILNKKRTWKTPDAARRFPFLSNEFKQHKSDNGKGKKKVKEKGS
jgi:hypothetical protein